MSFPLTTTLNRIHACCPCADGWRRGLTALGKTQGDDEPISFAELVDLLEFNDALWCCRSAPEHNAIWRRFAVWCAREVKEHLTDPRSLQALDVAERHTAGAASDSELATARALAVSAAWAIPATAPSAVWAAAWAAACTVMAASGAAAKPASGAAARVVARQRQVVAFRQLVTDGTLPPQGGEVEG